MCRFRWEETKKLTMKRARTQTAAPKQRTCHRPNVDSSGSPLSFALCGLRVAEELVLGWEWDDRNAVHSLPALLKTPGMFPSVFLLSFFLFITRSSTRLPFSSNSHLNL